MASFAQFGNDLYTGRRSINFIGRKKVWYIVSAVLILISLIGIFGRGLNFGLEFRGGTDFRVSQVQGMDDYEARAQKVVKDITGTTEAVNVSKLGNDQVRIQTEKFPDSGERSAQNVREALGEEFRVGLEQVSADEVGESWGQDVSRKALIALAVFLALVALVLALYFRTWKMSLAALVALLHDMVITVGVYALAGFEISPASVIGFLTILGYSLYDTVVVFDKVRENTDLAQSSQRVTFSQAVNLAVNQTLVRSINTTVVGLLPVGAILVVGFTLLGPGTLLDLALALFIGMAVGAYSSIFLAPPIYTHLREQEPEMKSLAKKAQRWQKDHPGQHIGGHMQVFNDSAGADSGPVAEPGEGEGSLVNVASAARLSARSAFGGTGSTAAGAGERTASGRTVHPSAKTGPRNQPRRQPRSKR